MNALAYVDPTEVDTGSAANCLAAVEIVLQMYGEEPIKIRLIHQVCESWLASCVVDDMPQ